MRGLQIVRRGVGDGTAQAVFAQPLINHAARLPTVYPQMAQRQESLQVQRGVGGEQRVACAHCQLQGFTHPVPPGEAWGNVFEAAEHQIQLAFIQRFARQGRAEVMDFDANAGRQPTKLLDQARHADQLHIVGDRYVETLFAARRVENFASAQALLDLLQRGANRTGQRLRPGRGLHGATHAHQQRIVEQHAQTIQCIAHRRLA